MIIAQLYKVTHLPTNLSYYGSVWAEGKTIQDRLAEHITHKGAKYISQMIVDGASPSEFSTELLLVGNLEYVCDLESKLAETNLWPRGLNGNAGKNIVRTAGGQKKVSNAVSAAKRGRTKETSAGVLSQSIKSAALKGNTRTEKQKRWDNRKSQFNKNIKKIPPKVEPGAKIVNNGKVNKRILPAQLDSFLKDGWLLGMLGDFSKSETHKENLRKPKSKLTCPHCNLSGGSSQMKRWHFDNCKSK